MEHLLFAGHNEKHVPWRILIGPHSSSARFGYCYHAILEARSEDFESLVFVQGHTALSGGAGVRTQNCFLSSTCS